MKKKTAKRILVKNATKIAKYNLGVQKISLSTSKRIKEATYTLIKEMENDSME